MAVTELAYDGLNATTPDNRNTSVPSHVGQDIAIEYIILGERTIDDYFPTVTMDSVSPSLSIANSYDDGAGEITYSLTYIWSMDDIETMPNYSASGFTALIRAETAVQAPSGVHWGVRYLQGVDPTSPVKQSEGGGYHTPAAAATDSAATFVGTDGDFLTGHGSTFSGNRNTMSVTGMTEDEDINAGPCRVWRYSGAIGVGDFNSKITLTIDLSQEGSRAWTYVIYTDDASSTTVTRVLKDNFVVTDARPGQIVSGRRPGERIQVSDDLRKLAIGHVLRDALNVTDAIQVSALNIVSRILKDDVSLLSDSVQATFIGTFAKQVADLLQTEDALVIRKARMDAILDSISVTDAIRRAYVWTRPLRSVVPEVYDDLVRRLLIDREVTDSLRVFDAIIPTYVPTEGEPSKVVTRALRDTIDNVTDAYFRVFSTSPTVVDQLAVFDRGLTFTHQRRRRLLDSISVTDLVIVNPIPVILTDIELAPWSAEVEDPPINTDILS